MELLVLNRPFAKALALLAVFPLSACLSVPPSSYAKLSRISPLEADAAALRFAVVTPEALRVRTGDIRFSIRYDGHDAAHSLIEETMPIVIDEPAATPGIPNEPGSGSRIQVAFLAPEDASRFAAIQRRIKAWQQEGYRGKGQVSLGATGCVAGPLTDSPLPVSTWIQTDQAEDFYPLNRPVDLQVMLKAAGKSAADIPACD